MPGIAANRMLCAHEAVAVKVFKEQEGILSREMSQQENGIGDLCTREYWYTAVDDDGIEENNAKVTVDVNFVYSRSRNFFPCESEDN